MRILNFALLVALFSLLAGTADATGNTAVFASNNLAGRYEDGIFRLPPLDDARDNYVLILTVDGKPQPAIELQAGVIGLIFGSNAVPRGVWSWTFALKRSQLPPLEVTTADQLQIPGGILTAYSGRLFLEWPKVPQSSTYRVAIATWSEAKAGKDAGWGDDKKLDVDCDEPELKAVCNVAIEAETGQRYRWSVTAIDDSKVDIARSVPRTIETAGSMFAGLKKSGWALQRADAGSDDDKKAALFSYARSSDTAVANVSSYSVAQALIWQAPVALKSGLYPRLSLETRRTSSGEAKDNDATTVRAGVFGTHTSLGADGGRTGYNWTTSAKFELAHKDGTRKGLVEFRLTPFLGPLGRYWDVPSVGADGRNSAGVIRPERFPELQIMPVLTLATEIGKTFEVGTSAETQDRIKRLRADLRFDMLWPRLAGNLGVLSVSSYAGGSYWRLLGQGDEYHLSQAGISIGLTPEISLDFAYKVGEEAPNFKFGRSTNVGFGIRF